MVRRSVQQQQVRLCHPDTAQHRDPLPAAAQGPDRHQPQVRRHLQLVQHDVHPPALGFHLLRRQCAAHGVGKGQTSHILWHLLRDMAHTQPTRPGDLSARRLRRPGQTAQQCRFPPPVCGDKADAVAGVDCQGKVGKQGGREHHAKAAQGHQGHRNISSAVPVIARDGATGFQELPTAEHAASARQADQSSITHPDRPAPSMQGRYRPIGQMPQKHDAALPRAKATTH